MKVLKNQQLQAKLINKIFVKKTGYKARFLETYDFLNSLDISYLHVFTYSERENTPAVEMPGFVPVNERKRRNKMLRILSAKKLRSFYEKQKGKSFKVLFESENKDGFMYGFTQNYVKVKHVYDRDLCNEITNVTLKDFDEEGNMSCVVHEAILQQKSDPEIAYF